MLPLSHVTECLIMPQFKGITDPIEVSTGTTTTVADYVSSYTGFSYNAFGEQVGWILLFIVVVQGLSFIATRKLVYSQR
jgi:hypothetical protein